MLEDCSDTGVSEDRGGVGGNEEPDGAVRVEG